LVHQLTVTWARGAAAAILVSGLLIGAAAAAEPRLVVSGGPNKELKGYLVKCGVVSAVEIRAPDGGYFESDRGDFGKLARNMRFILSNECRGLRKITFTGTVNGQLWYSGAVSIERKWRLYGLYAAPQ
jgi:hypothetical protein